jgi:hypothetical protein
MRARVLQKLNFLVQPTFRRLFSLQQTQSQFRKKTLFFRGGASTRFACRFRKQHNFPGGHTWGLPTGFFVKKLGEAAKAASLSIPTVLTDGEFCAIR